MQKKTFVWDAMLWHERFFEESSFPFYAELLYDVVCFDRVSVFNELDCIKNNLLTLFCFFNDCKPQANKQSLFLYYVYRYHHESLMKWLTKKCHAIIYHARTKLTCHFTFMSFPAMPIDDQQVIFDMFSF